MCSRFLSIYPTRALHKEQVNSKALLITQYLAAGYRRLWHSNHVTHMPFTDCTSLIKWQAVVSAPWSVGTAINRLLFSRAFNVIEPEFAISSAKRVPSENRRKRRGNSRWLIIYLNEKLFV